MPRAEFGEVELVDVDEEVLEALVRIALDDADADEVTPPLPGSSGRNGWSDEREQWLRDYHRSCRAGLDGPKHEASWAIVAAGAPVGAVRLKRTMQEGVLETGIWLARSARGRGLAPQSLAAVLEKARDVEARVVRADTAETNSAARALMRKVGFQLSPPDEARRVHGFIVLAS